jgi:hypothetical protein
MPRAAENPVYDDVQQNEIEDDYNEDAGEIQPAPEVPPARAPPNLIGQRFAPPPPPPIENRPQHTYGTIPSRPNRASATSKKLGKHPQGRDSPVTLQSTTKITTGHPNQIVIAVAAPKPRYNHTISRN